MWRRAILGLGGLGTLAFLVLGGLGYRLQGIGDDGMPVHVIGSLLALLVVLFASLWVVLFLVASRIAARRSVAAEGLSDELGRAAATVNGRAVAWSGTAALLTVATLVTGGLAYTASLPLWAHHATAGLAALVQVVALFVANAVLQRHDRLFADLEAAARRGGRGPL